MNPLNNIGNTVLASIQGIGWFWFVVLVLIDIILYRITPVLGLLGTLFLFCWMAGIIH